VLHMQHATVLTCMTVLRVVALFQSDESSRHKMMYSCCDIFCVTMASTCLAATCRTAFFLPGAAEIRPARKRECASRG